MIGVIACFKKLSKLLRKIQPDIVVNAQIQVITWALPFVCKNIPKIMEIHFSHIGMEYNIKDKGALFKNLFFHLPHIFTSVMTGLLSLLKKTSLIGKV